MPFKSLVKDKYAGSPPENASVVRTLFDLFFYKKTVYKNIQAEIPEKMRTSVRIFQPQIMARKRILEYFRQNLLFLIHNSMIYTYQY